MSSDAASLPATSSVLNHAAVAQQADVALQEHRQALFRRTDRLFAALFLCQGLIGGLAYGKAVWAQACHGGLGSWTPAAVLTLGAALFVLPLALAWARPGWTGTRHTLAVAQMCLSVLLTRLTGGYGEACFHVFGALAFLVSYRDWRVLASASTVALLLTGWLGAPPSLAGLALEDVLLLIYCRQGVREMREAAEREARLAAAERLVSRTLAKREWTDDALRAAHDRLHRAHEELDVHVQRRTAELAQANAALHRNNSVLRAQQEATVDGMLVVNENREVSTFNQRFCELWNIPLDSVIPDEKGLLERLLPDVKNPDAFLEVVEHCYAQSAEHCHDQVELCDGRVLDRYARPVISESGQCFGRVWYFRDVTERKRAEVQILGLNRELSRAYEAMTEAYDATIEGWSRAMDLRDKETEGHCRRVTDLTLRLAVSMGLCGEELLQIRRGALLHDIGKMGVPDQILLKPGPLTEDEWTVMRLHPAYAYEMLSPIPFLMPAIDIPWCHHEKWDGTGYPRGLKGEEIPLAARLFALVDVWDALRSDRPYREGWPPEKVKEYLRSQAGTHFDPEIVPVFLSVVDDNDMLPDYELFSEMEMFSEVVPFPVPRVGLPRLAA